LFLSKVQEQNVQHFPKEAFLKDNFIDIDSKWPNFHMQIDLSFNIKN